MSFSIISSKTHRLRPRSYVIAAIAIGFAGLFAVMAANVLIDPQGVFGTGVFGPVEDPNLRYLDLKAYQAAPDRYDGVLFASSRGGAIDLRQLAHDLGVHAVARFSMQAGQMSDYLPTLQYLIGDKASRQTRIAAVFVLLDADWFGTQPWTNNNVNAFLPPQLGGESRWHFWWRYLTIVQLPNWKRYISRALAIHMAAAHAAEPAAVTSPRHAAAAVTGAANSRDQPAEGARIRPDLAHQLDLFKRFVALCRDNNIKLVVAFSPLNARSGFAGDPQMAENRRVVAMVARIFPVWDFGRPAWLSQRQDLWLDDSHFKPEVGAMMLQRIFAGRQSIAPADFGELKDLTSPSS
jgi:hypothetical protein